MNTLKTSVSVATAIIGLGFGSSVLADTAYENDLGQSAQMSHTIQDQDSRAGSSRHQGVESNQQELQSSQVVEEFRERNTLGQSDAMSKTKPYRSLITDH